MDEVKIISKFTRGVISKLLGLVVRKKLGYKTDIQVNEITTTITDGNAHVHLDVDVELAKEELVKLLKNIGLDL